MFEGCHLLYEDDILYTIDYLVLTNVWCWPHLVLCNTAFIQLVIKKMDQNEISNPQYSTHNSSLKPSFFFISVDHHGYHRIQLYNVKYLVCIQDILFINYFCIIFFSILDTSVSKQFMEVWLSCYLVLLSVDSKAGNKTAALPPSNPYQCEP